MLGLDLFPGYDTFTAANIPVTGVLPILPGDYTANALFLGGGNTTTTAAMAAFAQENFDATTAGIVSADNAGANGTEADLKKALDAAGITYVSIKGGDNETDAGFQGLMAPGHGRRSRRAVLAVRRRRLHRHDPWSGRARHRDTGDHDRHLQQRRGDQPGRRRRRGVVLHRRLDRGDRHAGGRRPAGDPGVARLHQLHRARSRRTRPSPGCCRLATIANTVAADGGEVTGASIYEALGASDGVVNWPDAQPVRLWRSADVSDHLQLHLPDRDLDIPETGIETVPGFEALDTTPYLP